MDQQFDDLMQELIDAGIITPEDIALSKHDDKIEGDLNALTQLLKGGSGDDLLVGKDGRADKFFIDGRDRGNDEGRHVDVIRDFTIGEDTLSFRLDGGYFKTDGGDGDFYNGDPGEKLEQSSNGNQASFSSASDIADLLLHVNTRGTVDNKATGVTKSVKGFDTQDSVDAARDAVDAGDIKKIVQASERFSLETMDNSYVKVVGENIVINIDDYKHTEDHYDKWGRFKTTDKTIVLEDFEEQLASQFAVELGFNEFESNADSVHILGQDGDFKMGGGNGDNLFIMSAQQDTIQIDDRNTNNDENGHINIIHGFDLSEDGFSGRFDGGFFDGKNQATFTGATGLVELLAFAENVRDDDGNLTFDLQSVGGGGNRDPLTFVLTDTTLEDVYTAAQDQIFQALTDAEVFPDGSIPPAPGGNGDGIITDGNGNKGDDIFVATADADTFRFDSRDGAEDGTRGTTDKDAHVNVVVGFQSDDSLSFRIDGGYFADFAFKTINNNQALVTYDQIDELAEFINGKSGIDNDNFAFYDDETNSTILTLDDSPGRDGDSVSIVLWDSGDLL